jgi:hypothetical protein
VLRQASEPVPLAVVADQIRFGNIAVWLSHCDAT